MSDSELWLWLIITLTGAGATGWQARNDSYGDSGTMTWLCIGLTLCAAYWTLRLTGIVQ